MTGAPSTAIHLVSAMLYREDLLSRIDLIRLNRRILARASQSLPMVIGTPLVTSDGLWIFSFGDCDKFA
jgi:hypothetical protein